MPAESARRILVIDDDPLIGEEICESLELRNHSAVYVSNIEQAREVLSRDERIGIVICDYHMPGMNGIEVVQTLKREQHQPLEFIMLTGDESQAAAVEAVRAHVFEFLRKPVNGGKVADAVRRAGEELDRKVAQENRNEALEREARALHERAETFAKMLSQRETLLQRLLFTEAMQSRIAADKQHAARGPGPKAPPARPLSDDEDAAPLECLPVDVSLLVQRMMPALEKMSRDREVEFKPRVPNHLPFLYGDEKRLARAVADLAVVLISELAPGDKVIFVALKEERDLVLSFRIHSNGFAEDLWDALTRDLTDVIDNLDNVESSRMNLIGARVVVQLHGGRIAITKAGGFEWSIRIFFPLPAAEQESAPSHKLAVN
jgi:DNA-binding NarL/FixJ family response regulator